MSSSEPSRILVTSALPYANGPLHIGHLAGAYLPADMYCRFQRLMGRDVVYICGSDEHGVPIMLRARAEGNTPQDIVDRYHEQIHDAFRAFRMSFDFYGRTSSPIHRETSQEFFRTMASDSAFVLRKDTQLFDPEAKLFLADRFIRGTCPHCGYVDAYGDQCEQCGRSLTPKELHNPRSAITDSTPELRETTHWYLPLDSEQKWLEGWLDEKSNWKSNVLGQVRSWLNDGLAARSMTRDQPWGVPVPEDVAEHAGVDAEGKVLYVWFDAPIGYISATRQWAQECKGAPDLWKTYWQNDDTKLVHFIGKDNIVFHCIIFPAMLRRHGGYVLPSDVPANEFLNLKGLKFSTSRGVAVWAHEFLENYPADYLRYSIARTLPETKDADFSWSELQSHVNSELADTFGNFVNRTLTFALKYFEGVVPPLSEPSSLDEEMLQALAEAPAKIAKLFEAYRFREATTETMALARLGNKYFSDSEPWATRTSDRQRCSNTIHVSLQLSATLSILFEPIVPDTCATIRRMLHLEGVRSSAPEDNARPGGHEQSEPAHEAALGWLDSGRPLLESGSALGQAEILFQKIDDETIAAEMAELKSRAEAATEIGREPEAPYAALNHAIAFEDFAKLDLRVGKVLVAEKVKKSRKLLRTEIDFGFEKRQILAGVAEHFSAEDLVGRSVVAIVNLPVRKMAGLESQGMLLMAEDRDGKLSLIESLGEAGAAVG